MKPIPHSQSIRRRLFAAITIIILLTPAALGWQGAASVAALTSAEQEAAAPVKSETIREITTALASDEWIKPHSSLESKSMKIQIITSLPIRFAQIGTGRGCEQLLLSA